MMYLEYEIKIYKHSAGTWPGGAPDAGMEIRSCVSCAMAMNDSRRGSTPLPPPPPERWVKKWVFVHTVPMHQSASGFMEKTCVHRNARNIQTKGRLSHVRVTVHGGKNLATFFRAKNAEPPCLSFKCPRQSRTEPFQTFTSQPGNATIVPDPDADSIST